MSLRVIVFDRTCVWTRGHLSPLWSSGAGLYRALGRIDAARGVASWDEALAWIESLDQPVRELQYWGHGKWGCALVGDDALHAASIQRGRLDGLRAQLAPGALVWFRTCETLGAARGIAFAERLADFLGARVAGHTYVIGFHQSGLHAVDPGCRATWPATEGLADGDADAPLRAKRSHPWAPNTITCLHGEVPAAFVG
jgi:hypothetical protein